MRAYTSLAGHILGSHPDINGYYELHHDYRQDDGYQQQVLRYQKHDRLKKESHYLFDKLLHNDYQLTERLIQNPDNRILVSIRRPQPTIKSIINLFRNKQQPHPYQNESEATRYYCERLQYLNSFCQCYRGYYHYYDAEDWIQQPEILLPQLQNWLGLHSPLSQTYQQFSQTGKPRAGDSSETIKRGEIKREKTDYSDIELETNMLTEALDLYQQCRATVHEHTP